MAKLVQWPAIRRASGVRWRDRRGVGGGEDVEGIGQLETVAGALAARVAGDGAQAVEPSVSKIGAWAKIDV